MELGVSAGRPGRKTPDAHSGGPWNGSRKVRLIGRPLMRPPDDSAPVPGRPVLSKSSVRSHHEMEAGLTCLVFFVAKFAWR